MKSTRREFIGLLGFAAGTAAVFSATGVVPTIAGAPEEPILRPPGSLAEEEFLARCMRCKQCIEVCATDPLAADVLTPIKISEGLNLVNTPRRAADGCTACGLCAAICPSGSIGTNFMVAQILADACVGCFSCCAEGVCPVIPAAIVSDSVSGYPQVSLETCTGCGSCVTACTDLGTSTVKPAIVIVDPAVYEPLPAVNPNRKVAQILADACVGCFSCAAEGVCSVIPSAIVADTVSGYPQINLETCTGCGNCVTACTDLGISETKPAISLVEPAAYVALPASNPNRKVVKILDNCVGCGRKFCVEACLYDALHATSNGVPPAFEIEKCVGCGKCFAACPFTAMEMIPRPS